MKKGMAVAVGMVLLGLLAVPFSPALAEEKVSTRPVDIDKAPTGTGDPQKDQKCDEIPDSDERNLCRAFTRDDFNSEEQQQNRYQN